MRKFIAGLWLLAVGAYGMPTVAVGDLVLETTTSNTAVLMLQLRKTDDLTGEWEDAGAPVRWEIPMSGNDFFKVTASGEETMADTLTFETIDASTCRVIAYSGTPADVVIPSTHDGRTVVSIAPFCFYGSPLETITIPDSITSIGDQCFRNCSELTAITIPDSVTSIGDQCFFSCSSMASITLSESITILMDSCFQGCTSLTAITIPDSVTSIGTQCFFMCFSLTTITIPDSVISLGDSSFSECLSLASIIMKGNAPSLDASVFYGTPATIYYPSTATGYTNPWGGRPTMAYNGTYVAGSLMGFGSFSGSIATENPSWTCFKWDDVEQSIESTAELPPTDFGDGVTTDLGQTITLDRLDGTGTITQYVFKTSLSIDGLEANSVVCLEGSEQGGKRSWSSVGDLDYDVKSAFRITSSSDAVPYALRGSVSWHDSGETENGEPVYYDGSGQYALWTYKGEEVITEHSRVGYVPYNYFAKFEELITNGDFSNGTTGWNLMELFTSTGTMSVTNGLLRVVPTALSDPPVYWHLYLQQVDLSLISGVSYRLGFRIKADAEKYFVVELGYRGVTPFMVSEELTATTEWQNFSFEFVGQDYEDATFMLHLGDDLTAVEVDHITVLKTESTEDYNGMNDFSGSISHEADESWAIIKDGALDTYVESSALLPPTDFGGGVTTEFVMAYGTFPLIERFAYTLLGWYTEPLGEGEEARAGDELIVPNDDDTLYAKWIQYQAGKVSCGKSMLSHFAVGIGTDLFVASIDARLVRSNPTQVVLPIPAGGSDGT